MASPSALWILGNKTGNSSKEMLKNSVVQEISIFNADTSNNIVFTIYRVPAADVSGGPYQIKNKIRANITVLPQQTVTLSNLRWVLSVGDYLSVSVDSPSISRNYNIFVDGVEFD